MTIDITPELFASVPDADGRFGHFGGKFVAETLMSALSDLEALYARLKDDAVFQREFDADLAHYVGRPSPLYEASRLSDAIGGGRIYLKREDLNHTGAHKVNNTIGQARRAKHMGKRRGRAETGASGSRTLKDAMNEALRDWVTNVDDTFYIIGTVAGPHPYPMLVRDFQSVIGREARVQSLAQAGKLPAGLVACVGGGSNAIGLFHPFLQDAEVAMYGVEAGGKGLETGAHAAPLSMGSPGVLHGNRTYLMQDDDGQILDTHSVSAGLDYPGVGPEHAWLKDIGRVNYVAANDDEALAAFHRLTRVEGIMPALETAHAMAYAERLAAEMSPDEHIIVNLSGRGDKDILTVAAIEGIEV